MKTTGLFAKFLLYLVIKVTDGQLHDLLHNENIGTINPVSQQQTIGNNPLLSDNGNQHQMLMRTNTPSPNTKQIQLPPDLQQQPLQVQQYLQLQKPIQPHHLGLSQPSLQMQLQPSSQPEQPLKLQTQQFLQSQQLLQTQQSQLPLQGSQPLQFQQTFQVQEPSQITQTFQSHQMSQGPSQASLGFVQNSPLALHEPTNFLETPVTQQISNIQPNSQLHVKWKSSNPQSVVNIGEPPNRSLAKVIDNTQKSYDKSHEFPLLRYNFASQQPSFPSKGILSSPVDFNSQSISTIPNYNVKSPQETYVSGKPTYNRINPTSDIQFSALQKSVNSIPLPSSILSVQSPQIPNYNMETYYYNQLDTDFKPYINQNAGFRYPQPSQLPVTIMQSQPQAIVPSQSAILPSVPISIVQAPSASPHYVVSSGYPINTIVAPAYTSQSSNSPNLKSFMPLIFNLLKERIASCGCRKECPCECKNNSCNNELEVSSGYSRQKNYGSLDNDNWSVLNNVSGEVEGTTYLRGRKNCDRIGKGPSKATGDILEEDDSDEEIDEGEDE